MMYFFLKRGAVIWTSLALTVCITGCEITNTGDETPFDAGTGRGAVVSIQTLETLTAEAIRNMGLPLDVLYDVRLDQVVYETVDAFGVKTNASGLAVIPIGAPGRLPLVSYQHGTETLRDGVAGVGGSSVPEAMIAVAFATGGYVAVMTDYLGLGVSEGLHPYMHANSLATSTVDMIRASHRVAVAGDVELSEQVFLAGYSEGGFATAAAQLMIESVHADEIILTASALMAGPYDISESMVDVIRATEPYDQPYYLAYTVLAYDMVYGMFTGLNDFFQSPYDSTLPGLYDGTRSAGALNAALPNHPVDLIQPSFLEAFDADENHPFKVALRENDRYDWTPVTATKLYHCTADELVPFASSERAFERFQQGGANAELVPLDFGGHVDCVAPAMLLAKFWFDSLLPSAGAAKKAPTEIDLRRAAQSWRPFSIR